MSLTPSHELDDSGVQWPLHLRYIQDRLLRKHNAYTKINYTKYIRYVRGAKCSREDAVAAFTLDSAE